MVRAGRRQPQAAEWFAAQCEALALDGRVRAESVTLQDIAVQASEPLRVAVASAVSVGKSTLVNALLGTKLAAVAHEETTSRVAWYRDPGLAAPAPLGGAHDLVAAAFPLSGTIVLVDTPGLDTVSGNQLSTETMFCAEHPAAGAATALIYLVEQSDTGTGLEWVRRFAALNAGPFELHAGIVVVGSKADLYESGGFARGSSEASRVMIRTLREDIERKAGRLAGHFGALMPTLASLARTEDFDHRVLAQVETVARDAALRAAAAQGWPFLTEVATDRGADLDVTSLSELIGSNLGLTSAAELLAMDKPADPYAALRRLWLEMSGVRDLENQLSKMAAAGTALTVTAVVRRLERLAARLGRNLGKPVHEVLAQWRTHPLRTLHNRQCAALVLDGDEMPYLTVEDRLAAALLLRGEGGPLPREARARWARAGAGWQATSRDAQIIRMVLDISLQEAGSAAS